MKAIISRTSASRVGDYVWGSRYHQLIKEGFELEENKDSAIIQGYTVTKLPEIEINTLEDLISFYALLPEEDREIIFSVDRKNNILYLEIYDSYRE